jgi:hypothetical protein
MTFIEHGTLGAFRATWRKGNPRALLETIINKNPKASENDIYKLFWTEIEDDKELLRAITGYWLDHNYRSLTRPISQPNNGQKPARAQRIMEAQQQLKERIVHETRVMLLDLIMPNEKKLSDCTGKECCQFGGWLQLVGHKVPATKTVGETLTEKQLQSLYRSAPKK